FAHTDADWRVSSNIDPYYDSRRRHAHGGNYMLSTAGKLAATIVLATSVYSFAGVASAAPMTGALALKNAAPANVESVQFRGWGWGAGAGFVAGAIIGGAIANSYYYGPGPYYAAPGPYYYAPPPPPAAYYGAPAGPAYGAPAGP